MCAAADELTRSRCLAQGCWLHAWFQNGLVQSRSSARACTSAEHLEKQSCTLTQRHWAQMRLAEAQDARAAAERAVAAAAAAGRQSETTTFADWEVWKPH